MVNDGRRYFLDVRDEAFWIFVFAEWFYHIFVWQVVGLFMQVMSRFVSYFWETFVAVSGARCPHLRLCLLSTALIFMIWCGIHCSIDSVIRLAKFSISLLKLSSIWISCAASGPRITFKTEDTRPSGQAWNYGNIVLPNPLTVLLSFKLIFTIWTSLWRRRCNCLANSCSSNVNLTVLHGIFGNSYFNMVRCTLLSSGWSKICGPAWEPPNPSMRRYNNTAENMLYHSEHKRARGCRINHTVSSLADYFFSCSTHACQSASHQGKCE